MMCVYVCAVVDLCAVQEILGMSYIGPSYDMWKLGCLLYEATTDKKLFDDRATLRLAMAKQGKTGYSDQHLFLDRMVTVLGNIPREVCACVDDELGVVLGCLQSGSTVGRSGAAYLDSGGNVGVLGCFAHQDW